MPRAPVAESALNSSGRADAGAAGSAARPRAVMTAAPVSAAPTRFPMPIAGQLATTSGVAIAVALLAAWLAAGSTGLIGDALRNSLALFAIVVSAVMAWPGVALVAAAIAVGAIAIFTDQLGVNVAGIGLALLIMALGRPREERDAFTGGATGIAALSLYLTAKTAIPSFWLWLDGVGTSLSAWVGPATGLPLSAGAYFAGVDFLVTMLALWVAWLCSTPGPRVLRGLFALAAIGVAHAGYLIALTYAGDWAGKLPPLPGSHGLINPLEPPKEDALIAAGRMLLPWNVPLMAALAHGAIAAAMLCWTRWRPAANAAQTGATAEPAARRGLTGVGLGLALVAIVASALLPPVTMRHGLGAEGLALTGKKVLCYEKGFLNWLVPKWGDYGRLTIGMYGLLPTFVESLGGTCKISEKLTEEELAAADVLILLFPNEKWDPEMLERIRTFVRKGGGLLVMGEHTACEDDDGDGIKDIEAARFNEVLDAVVKGDEATAGRIRVNFDSSTFAVGGWLDSYEPLAHPITAGVRDNRNDFGCVIGASLAVTHPARPILIGRFGWADPGDLGTGPAMMGNDKYDPGERLGDQILIAEQKVESGRVIAFGDTSSITNGIMFGSYEFLSRLLGYLARRDANVHPSGVQIGGIILLLAALAALLWRPSFGKTAATSAALAATLYVSATQAANTWFNLPDGTRKTPNDVAYVDISHVLSVSEESLRENALMGLHLVLLRENYLALTLPEITRDRLSKAGLMILCAPTGRYTPQERAIIRDWVVGGGHLIVTAGYDRFAPVKELLADYNLTVGLNPLEQERPVLEPWPLGFFKSPFLRTEEDMFHVRFHAAWAVWTTDVNLADPRYFGAAEPRVLAYGGGDVPVIIMRSVGQGKVVLIGDSNFATNENLENIDGQPFEGMRENAEFWRFLIGELRGPKWTPERLEQRRPRPAAPPTVVGPPAPPPGANPAQPPEPAQPTDPAAPAGDPGTPPADDPNASPAGEPNAPPVETPPSEPPSGDPPPDQPPEIAQAWHRLQTAGQGRHDAAEALSMTRLAASEDRFLTVAALPSAALQGAVFPGAAAWCSQACHAGFGEGGAGHV